MLQSWERKDMRPWERKEHQNRCEKNWINPCFNKLYLEEENASVLLMKPNTHEPLSAISSHLWQIKSTRSLGFWHFCGAVAVGCLILCRKGSWKWKLRIQGCGDATLSLWIVRAAALVSGYLQEPAKHNFLPRTEIASSSSMWDICVFVVIYDQGHKAILGELGKVQRGAGSAIRLLSGNSFLSLQFDSLSVSWGHKDEGKNLLEISKNLNVLLALHPCVITFRSL